MKNLQNLGQTLSKAELKTINGGAFNGVVTLPGEGPRNPWTPGGGIGECDGHSDCPNAVNPHTGNYCQGICQHRQGGSVCIVDAC